MRFTIRSLGSGAGAGVPCGGPCPCAATLTPGAGARAGTPCAVVKRCPRIARRIACDPCGYPAGEARYMTRTEYTRATGQPSGGPCPNAGRCPCCGQKRARDLAAPGQTG